MRACPRVPNFDISLKKKLSLRRKSIAARFNLPLCPASVFPPRNRRPSLLSPHFRKIQNPDKDLRRNINRPISVPFFQEQQRSCIGHSSNRRDFEARPDPLEIAAGEARVSTPVQTNRHTGSSIYKRAEKRHAPANSGIYFYGPDSLPLSSTSLRSP